MKHLLIGAAAAALLVGCGGKNEAGGDAPVAKGAKIDINHPELMSLADFDVGSGNAAKAGDALTALSLDGSGNDLITFGGSDTNGAGATFTNVVISPPGEDEAVKVGKMEFSGLDMSNTGATFSKLSLSDITMGEGSDDGTGTIDSLQVINPSPALAAWLSKGLSGQEPGDLPPIEQISFDAISLDNFQIEGMDGDPDNNLRIADITLQGMKNNELAAAVLSGLTVNGMEDGESIKVGLKKMALYGADYEFVEKMQSMGPGADEDEMMELFMAAMSDGSNPPYDGMVVEDMTFDGSGIDFDLPSVDVFVKRDSQDRMTATVLKPMRMTLKADADGGEGGAELAEGLSMLGYKEIALKAEGVTRYDPDTDIVSYEAGSNYIELEDGARLSYSGKFEGFKEYSAAMSQMGDDGFGPGGDMEAALEKMTIHSFELTIDDDSLVDRVFTLAATQSGEDPQEMRNQTVMMMGMAPMMAAGSGVDMELVQEGVSALTEFLQEPGTLKISLKPATPIKLSEFEDPSKITKKALGFSANHKK